MKIDPLTIFAASGVISLIIERFFYYKSRYKTNKKDKIASKSESLEPNPKPGMAQTCINHSNDIGKIWTEIDNFKDEIKEMKQNMKDGFDKLEKKLERK